MKRLLALITASSLLAGCATNPENIQAAYVSPMQYQNYSCSQLSEEATRVSARAVQATGAQSSQASGDAVKMGVALVVFWPALFFLSGDGANAAELGRLKGEMDAIEQASVKRKCGIQFKK